MSGDDLRLLTLHGLRLTGLASPDEIAAVHSLDPARVEEELAKLSTDDLVAPARVEGDRWTLTTEGRDHGQTLLACELDGADPGPGSPTARATVTDAYDRFCGLNQPMLEICTRWQLLSQDPPVVNDHTNRAHDDAVVTDLRQINGRVQPICAQLESVLSRFRRYGPGFTEALFHVGRGRNEWLTKPTIFSYHTLWFQLHEDLLATLGLERAAETARLHGSPRPPERPLTGPTAHPGSAPPESQEDT